jgi:hypothetical protein
MDRKIEASSRTLFKMCSFLKNYLGISIAAQAETEFARLWAFDIAQPGVVNKHPPALDAASMSPPPSTAGSL